MESKKLSPMHPGEILQKEFLEPMSLTIFRGIKTANM